MQHSFKTSLSKEAQFIKEERHLPVLKQLNKQLASEHKVKLDPETYKEYYGNSKEEKEKNKLGIDADCDIISSETGKIVKEAFAIDYKIRFKAYQPLDFLAEIISVDWKNALDSGKFSDIKEKKASNRGYNTISIPIRIDRLKKECPTTLIFNYE